MNASKPLESFHLQLHRWYQTHGRHELPWRHTGDAYRILVSEMMLQQTQVQTVLDRYYQLFLDVFPTLESLANAQLSKVMEQWQGLGYYRRAKYLHAAAQQSAPALPDTVEGLMALPGIGRNTAHAVLAFAHHQPYPVMEANVKRVLSRIFALTQPTEKALWQHAFGLLDQKDPYDYNQAMMDVGSMVCTPKSPNCTACPASELCQGKANPQAYPAPKAKKIIPTRKQQILVIENDHGLIYSSPRAGEFLHGLHQFVELGENEGAIELNGAIYPKANWHYLGIVEQTYSHFKQWAEVYRVRYHGKCQPSHWYSLEKLKHLPCSKKEEKIIKMLV